MPDKSTSPAPADAKPAAEKKKGALPLKTIILVLGLLIVEAGAVIGVLTMWAGPAKVQGGDDLHATAQSEDQSVSELLIISDRFPNHQTGKIWLWDTEIQVQVMAMNRADVEATLEARNAEIKTALSALFRNAHHRHLTEPSLETITRQVKECLDTVFGEDAEGRSRIHKVLIPRCVGLPGDF